MGYSKFKLLHEIITNMKCPNDKSNLVLRTQEGVFANCCEKCSGIFLKHKDVQAFRFNFGTYCLEKAFNSRQSQNTDQQCSLCKKNMKSVKMDQMQISICHNCNSAFFELGQIAQIKELNTNEEHDDSLVIFLPPSLLVFYSFIRFFLAKPKSKERFFYVWMFSIGLFFVIVFWHSIASTTYVCH